jgi:hypothetical protein
VEGSHIHPVEGLGHTGSIVAVYIVKAASRISHNWFAVGTG